MKENAKRLVREAWRSETVRGLVAWLVVFGVLCAVNWPLRLVPFWWDAMGYVYLHSLQIYEAGLFPILRGFDVGHPTLVYFLIAVLMKLGSSAVFAGHIVTWALTALSIVSIYALCRSMDLPRLFSCAGALLFVTFPITWANVHLVLLDLPLTAFALAAFACWARRHWCGYFIFGAAAMLTKIYGFSILTGPVAALLLTSGRPRDFTRNRDFWKEFVYTASPLVPLVLFLIARYFVRGAGLTLGFDHPDEIVPFSQIDVMIRRAGHIYLEIYKPTGLDIALGICFLFVVLLGVRVLVQDIARKELVSIQRMDVRALLPALVWAFVSQGILLLVKEHQCARYALLILPAVTLITVYTAWKVIPYQIVLLPAAFLAISIQIVFWHPSHARILPAPFNEWFEARTPRHGWFWEKDLHFLDATELVRWAAATINEDEDQHPGRSGLATGWPIDGALRTEGSGYTDKPFRVARKEEWIHIDSEETRYALELPPIFTIRGTLDGTDYTREELARRRIGSAEAVIWLLHPVKNSE